MTGTAGPSRMLHGAPPAAGPAGTVGRARATPELHDAERSGTAGYWLNRDHWQCTGRGSYASTHAHLGTAGRETRKGTVGCERRSCVTRSGHNGCRRDEVTVRFEILPLNWEPKVLKQTARKLVSPVTTQLVCESR